MEAKKGAELPLPRVRLSVCVCVWLRCVVCLYVCMIVV